MLIIQNIAFKFYSLIWSLAIPLLKQNHRLFQGFDQRILKQKFPQADLWIQAASVGESYLALEILKNLNPNSAVKILITSTTSQGIEILTQETAKFSHSLSNIKIKIAYFPFDKPEIMKCAVNSVRPKVMVILETEIWPGLMMSLKKFGTKVMMINARISPKSLRNYKLIWFVWKNINPDKILAISHEHGKRFKKLFQDTSIDIMSNIKFDRIGFNKSEIINPLEKILNSDASIVVLGSIRSKEEAFVEKIILHILKHHPQTIICLFPRHLHRVVFWQKRLEKMSLAWKLRSQINAPISKDFIILWDIFGELSFAYELADAAFVGASLVPLGGQNFIEPLTAGICPVIGPFWKDFEWVGKAIFQQGLVKNGKDWQTVAKLLCEDIQKPLCHEYVRKSVNKYLKKHQGGTKLSCKVINNYLK